MVNDPISDLLIRIMNAQRVGHQTVKVPFSRIKFELVKILEQEKFVETIKKEGKDPKSFILINLKYLPTGQAGLPAGRQATEDIPAIHSLKRISKPSQRIYMGKDEIKPIKKGYGLVIISTSLGLMTDKEAKKRKIGGEILCEVW